MTHSKRLIFSVLIILGVVTLDLASKMMILTQAQQGLLPYAVTPFLNFTLVWNKGMSFGIFNSGEGASLMLGGLAVLLMGYLGYLLIKAETFLHSMFFAWIIGGALGNLYDRLVHRAVVDFIDFHILGHHWYVFNIADAAIVGGVFFLLIDQIFYNSKEKPI